jgi:hypothetical protein
MFSLLMWFMFSLLVAIYASNRGHSGIFIFLLSVVLSPAVVLVGVLGYRLITGKPI